MAVRFLAISCGEDWVCPPFSFSFWAGEGLTARKLAWAVGIPRHLKVYPVGVQLIWPVTKVRGRPRKRHVPDSLSTAAEDMLASAQWRTVSWRSVPRFGSKPGLPPSVCVLPTVLPAADMGQGAAASSRGRGLADRRAPRVGREEILSRQIRRRNGPPQLSCDDQGTMDLRAGPSTVEGGTRARPLRGKVLARPSSSMR